MALYQDHPTPKQHFILKESVELLVYHAGGFGLP